MTENILFFIVFLGQVFLISYYYPRKLMQSREYVFETYPPSTYPKLYPNSMSYYQAQQRSYRLWNQLNLVIGLGLGVFMVSKAKIGEWETAWLTWYFLLQVFPTLRLEIASFKEFKQMRIQNSQRIRKAELQPRRLFDFVSPAVIGLAAAIYVLFVIFIMYFKQFNYPWFGGYWNIVGITGMNIFYAAIVFWYMYGKKVNPHTTNQDRSRQTAAIAKIMVFISIAATISVSLNIMLAAAELRSLQPIAHTVYFQLLAVLSFQFYKNIYYTNFEVYREEALPN
jgi:hypothetical protein